VVFDLVVRYLRARGFQVIYVRNITDIDDKILCRAAENGEEIGDLTRRFIECMHEDSKSLGVLPPDFEPRATESISTIQNMVQRLLEKGYAYQASNRDVYYDVSQFASYGKLSGRRLEELRAGVRVDVIEAKEDPLDFVLWKSAKPGEPAWDSPWGPGRPGWHIECSAMSTAALGNHFDIHGGGADLQFPHHENEIAQSEAATGEPFVNLWMHNGFVCINEEKMSKSLGNFFTVRAVLKYCPPEAVRFFILASHYRSPLQYSQQNLDAARAALTRLYTALQGLNIQETVNESHFSEQFFEAMEDDFNTPKALAACFDLAREINRVRMKDLVHATKLAAELRRFGDILGILQTDPTVFLHGTCLSSGDITIPEVEEALAARQVAQKNKNFVESDRIRSELKQRGILLEDRPGHPTTWRREKA